MLCKQAILSLFLLGPCGEGGSSPDEVIAAAVANPARPVGDVARDEFRKPDTVLSFFAIKPGMTVLDVFAGGGYYTELLNYVVGDEGLVLTHNNDAFVAYVGNELSDRFAANRLPHSRQVIAEADDLELADNSLDAALMVLAYHDFFYASDEYNWPDPDEAAFITKLCRAMKPGAVLGIIDHVANPGGDVTRVAADLHRIDPARVIEDFSGSCFKLEGVSNALHNPADDHSLPMSDPAISGKTDRFMYKFVRR